MFRHIQISFLLSTTACIPNIDNGTSKGPGNDNAQEQEEFSDTSEDEEMEEPGEPGEPGEPEEEPAFDASEICHNDITGWDNQWAAVEEEVVTLVNNIRAQGTNCGEYGDKDPVGPVEMDPHLRCSARYHSIWMQQTGVFDHDSPGGDLGDDPWQRIAATDFTGYPTGENIAYGYGSAEAVMEGWLSSDGHCANIMMPGANAIGIGFHGTSRYWTQNFGWID